MIALSTEDTEAQWLKTLSHRTSPDCLDQALLEKIKRGTVALRLTPYETICGGFNAPWALATVIKAYFRLHRSSNSS